MLTNPFPTRRSSDLNGRCQRLNGTRKSRRLFEQRDPGRAARVQPIMVTIYPERDTPAVLKEFVSAFHPLLIGLTGSPAAVAATLSRFGIHASRQQRDGSSAYLMDRSEEHTSELQSLMRISYAVFCLKQKNI